MKITFATAPGLVRARYPKATVEHVTRNDRTSYYLVYARETEQRAGETYIGTGSILKAENDR